MTLATPATGLIAVAILFVLLLAGVRIGVALGLVGLGGLALSKAALTLLQRYPWPGNVRELEHAIHRAAVLARAEQGTGEVLLKPSYFCLEGPTATVSQLPPAPAGLSGVGLREALDEFQARLIRQTLESFNGNWSATARELQLDTGNLHRLARRLGIK